MVTGKGNFMFVLLKLINFNKTNIKLYKCINYRLLIPLNFINKFHSQLINRGMASVGPD